MIDTVAMLLTVAGDKTVFEGQLSHVVHVIARGVREASNSLNLNIFCSSLFALFEGGIDREGTGCHGND